MSTPSLILFGIAFLFYLLTWKYICQIVREVNADSTSPGVSMWKWHRGWRIHRQLFPASLVRLRLVGCVIATVGLGLLAFCIEASNLVTRLHQ